ncbi:hypothetical protein SERLADRAFT_444119 [Serpula lacrymans var. lacrymans S7.9]|uniref:Uncharacterized protein n=1 Tax=Serpula lacrymans var. lacrymans (strain S7.9) TaxID=578457 RepID=F8PEJ7_SERL9|nr:uncharacterized protein SERLADRAFT_444119 [Serpula lacrymans var. lacrymans S7.9]EGO18448.1 hypothetical protein SERLADRAFT_444119 [Serpula lacrymans var. lacrymans S7.9]
MNSAFQKQLSDIVKTIRSIPFNATVEAVKNKPSNVEAKALFWQQESLLSQEFNKAEVLMPKVREMPLYKTFMKKVEYVREMETKEDDAIDEEEDDDMEEEVPPTVKYQSPGQIPQTPMTKMGPPRIRIPARKVSSKGKEREKEPERIKPRYRQVEVVITKKRYAQNVPSPSKDKGKTEAETPSKGKGKAKETPSKDTITPKKQSKPIPYIIPCAECLSDVKKEGPLCCVKEFDNPRGTSCIPCQRKRARCYWRSSETRKALLKHQWTEDSWAPPSKEEIEKMDLQELLATRVKCAEMSLMAAETLWDLSKIQKKKLST